MINNISNRSNPYFGAKISFDPYFDRHPRVKVPTPYDQFVKGLYYLSDSEVKDVEKLLDKLNNTAKGAILQLCPCDICQAYTSSGRQYNVFELIGNCNSDKWQPKNDDLFFYDTKILLERLIKIAKGLDKKAISRDTKYIYNDYYISGPHRKFNNKVQALLDHDVFKTQE